MAATGIKAISVATKDMHMIDPRTIVVESSWNRRDFKDSDNIRHVEELSRSIEEIGVLNPFIVRYDKDSKRTMLRDGECRLRATLLAIERGADIKAVPCVTESADGLDEADMLLAQGMRNEGKRMSDLEWSKIIAGLLRYEWSVEDIARKTGRGVAWVNSKIALAEAPVAAKAMVRDGHVKANTVTKMLKDKGTQETMEVLEDVVTEAKNEVAAEAPSPDTPLPSITARAVAKKVVRKLEERGGVAPMRKYSGEQTREMVRVLREIIGLSPASAKESLEKAQGMAINILESMDALGPEETVA